MLMEKLNYKTLKESGYKGYILETAPEKVLQFGGGNFLRAFTNYWFDVANEKVNWNGKCVIVQSVTKGLAQRINSQQGLYTLYLRGAEKGVKVEQKRVISSISRCVDPYTQDGLSQLMEIAVSEDLEYVVSNTTEAGIVYDPGCKFSDKPCASFPGKLTQVLYARYQAGKKGLVILSCELIDNNGKVLRECVKKYAEQWKLEPGFIRYVDEECLFCSTLVDRIVPGNVRDPKEKAEMDEQNGYIDELLDVGEVFGVWNIEGPRWLEDKLPFKAAGVSCTVVPDVTPYKKRKVRILNGAHTGTVLGAYLAGFDIVRDCMYNDAVSRFMNKMLYDEVMPKLPLEREDLEGFAASVYDRFCNPFINHEILSISLNATSKWRARILPSLLDCVKANGELPKCLTMSFAAYIAFYTSNIRELTEKGLVCCRPDGTVYTCCDVRWVLDFYWQHKDDNIAKLVKAVMRNERMWGKDLTQIPGFEEATVKNLQIIRSEGTIVAYESCL